MSIILNLMHQSSYLSCYFGQLKCNIIIVAIIIPSMNNIRTTQIAPIRLLRFYFALLPFVHYLVSAVIMFNEEERNIIIAVIYFIFLIIIIFHVHFNLVRESDDDFYVIRSSLSVKFAWWNEYNRLHRPINHHHATFHAMIMLHVLVTLLP